MAKYTRTIIGWFNVTIEGATYNVDPASFTRITGVAADVTLGCGELSVAQVAEVQAVGRLVHVGGRREAVTA